jgi:hypothetical protein
VCIYILISIREQKILKYLMVSANEKLAEEDGEREVVSKGLAQ